MTTTLFETKTKASGTSKGMIISMVLHGALITAALYGTAQVMLPPREKFEEHPILYVATPPPPPIHVAPEPLPVVKTPPKAKAPPSPKRFVAPKPAPVKPAAVKQVAAPVVPTVVAPTKVALSLPSVDLKAAPIAEIAIAVSEPVRAASTSGSASGRTSDDDGVGSRGGLSSGAAGKAYDENQVDRTVEVSRATPPVYPAALRSVNVEGAVVMSFIVGADGRVEPGSIKVVSTPHRLFGDAMRTALLSTRYRAAEANGQKVRQLVEQSFTFKLDKQ